MPGKAKYTLGKVANLHDIELPSGQTCQARRPGVQGLIAAGLLDSFDELTSLVQTDHIGKKTIAAAPKVTDAQIEAASASFLSDPTKMHKVMLLADRLAAYVITQPPVWIDYQMKDESDEDFASRVEKAEADGAISVREIDLDDKMFLVQWSVGGTSDLTSFR